MEILLIIFGVVFLLIVGAVITIFIVAKKKGGTIRTGSGPSGPKLDNFNSFDRMDSF